MDDTAARDPRDLRDRRVPSSGSAAVVSGEPLSDALRAELAELTATLCHALNDPKRLLLIHALANGPSSVSALAAMVEASVANVSQHLAVLRDRGLVDSERDGLNVIYSLRYPELVDAVAQLRGILRTELQRRGGLLA